MAYGDALAWICQAVQCSQDQAEGFVNYYGFTEDQTIGIGRLLSRSPQIRVAGQVMHQKRVQVCPGCGETFEYIQTTRRRVWCSDACRMRTRRLQTRDQAAQYRQHWQLDAKRRQALQEVEAERVRLRHAADQAEHDAEVIRQAAEPLKAIFLRDEAGRLYYPPALEEKAMQRQDQAFLKGRAALGEDVGYLEPAEPMTFPPIEEPGAEPEPVRQKRRRWRRRQAETSEDDQPQADGEKWITRKFWNGSGRPTTATWKAGEWDKFVEELED